MSLLPPLDSPTTTTRNDSMHREGRSRRRIVAAALTVAALLVAPLASASRAGQQTPLSRPTLVILIAVDQMRADYLDRFRDQFEGGFRTLLEQGAVFTNAHQSHAITATAPGHASMLSGLYPSHHGIIDNDWWDRDLHRAERAGVDPDYHVVGLDPTSDTSGPSGSPRQFHGSTLVGWLHDQDPRSQAVSISRKDRAAILMAPEAKNVYWFHWSGRFVTSDYYRQDLPEWVQQFNDTDWLSDYAGATWTLLQADALYASSRPDEYLGEARLRDFGDNFPHTLPKDRRELGNLITTTPFMDLATLNIGRAAIDALHLGADDAVDVLALGLSATDAVGHAFGPFSREMQDHLLRLDLELEGFLDYVDQTVGLDHVILVLTADHGVAPLPEYSKTQGEDAKRLDVGAMLNGLDRHIASIYGPGRWFSGYSYGWLQLNRELCNQVGADPDQVLAEAITYLKTRPEIAAVFSRADLERDHPPQSDLEARVRRSFYPSRAGDIYIIHPPYSIWQTGAAANHQSPYFYDSHVPLILRGPGVEPGRYGGRVEIVDLAPTLAELLNVPTPDNLDGRVLREGLAR